MWGNTTASNAKIQIENWYNENIENNSTYANKVADGKFCNDRSIASGYIWSSESDNEIRYSAYERLYTNKNPSLSCSNLDEYILKVGLITADEVAYAGGVSRTSNSANTSYYVYNGTSQWTITPGFYGGKKAKILFITSEGKLAFGNTDGTSMGTLPGLRPVINLRSDVTFAVEGNGTQSNPYIVQY